MKIKHLVIILLCSFISTLAAAQGFTVVEIEGEKYYSHKVEAGHTLYAIAVLYNSDEEIIREYNSEILNEGLKVGQTIYVPLSPDFDPKVLPNPIRIENGFLIHRVGKKETLYSICKKYTVDMNDVSEINSLGDDQLKKGQELKIPVNDVNEPVTVAPAVNFEASKWKTHTVLSGETLYGISKKFDVKITEILKINPELSSTGLVAGNTINIPLELEQGEEPDSMKDVISSWERKGKNPFKETYEVAMALPFYLNSPDSVDLSGKEKLIQKIAVSFYRGAYLAALELEEEGLSMNVNVLDITDDREQVRTLASDEEMHKMDLFIGPFQKEALKKVVEISRGSGAQVVCPTPQSGAVLLSNPNINKVMPSSSTLMGEAAVHIATQKNGPNVILVKTDWVEDKRRLQVFEKKFNETISDSASFGAQLKIIEAGSFSASSLRSRLSETRENIIVMPTGNRASVGRLMNTLAHFKRSKNLSVYLIEKWMDSDYIDAEMRNTFQIHFPTSYSGDISTESLEEFEKMFEAEFSEDIDKYAVLGHDIMLFYGRALQNFGLDYGYYLSEVETTGILNYIFKFNQVGPDSGFENLGTHIVFYNNYELVEEK